MGRVGRITSLAVVSGAIVFIWPAHIEVLGTDVSCGVGQSRCSVPTPVIQSTKS